jgi:hypothetical protein
VPKHQSVADPAGDHVNEVAMPQVALREDAETMLELAGQYFKDLPEEAQPELVERILDCIVDIYRQYRTPLPPWLARLRPEAGKAEAAAFCPAYLHRLESVIVSELIRANLRSAVENHRRGFAGVARELGVRTAAFRRFMAGSLISTEVWKPLSEYALERGQGLPAHGSLGLALTVSTLPQRVRERARLTLADHLSTFLEATGERCPDWLIWEMDWPYG